MAAARRVGLTGQDGSSSRAKKMLLPAKRKRSGRLGQVGEIESIESR